MLSIRDLCDQFDIEGDVIVKTVDDDGNETILFEDSGIEFEDGDFMEKDIKYMYSQKYGFGTCLVIEVSE